MDPERNAGVLTVTDSRTGRTYEIPITDGAVHATELRRIKTAQDDFGLLSYDPAFLNTASCRSAITFIDGDTTPSRSSPSRGRSCRSRGSC